MKDFPQMASLESLAMVKVAVEIWSHPDIKEAIARTCLGLIEWWKLWDAIQKDVRIKIQQLMLPRIQKMELFIIIQQMGLHLQMWFRNYNNLFKFSEKTTRAVVDKLCWTPSGKIDDKKTIELLLDSGTLDLRDGYTFASNFRLGHRVAFVWDRLSAECY